MAEAPDKLIGVGLYTAAEAGRLVQVPPKKIIRWLRGHTMKGKWYEPLWHSQIDLADDGVYLGFRDLMEVRVAAAFIARGLPPVRVRQAILLAQDIVGTDHPLSTNKFRTDGRTVFLHMDAPRGDAKLIDLFRRQHVFREIVEPSLKGIDFDEDGIPSRWWPRGRQAGIVVDPERSFGNPIEAETAVPAEILAAAAAAEGSAQAAARVWSVPTRAVRRAVTFQNEYAHRKAA